MGREVRGVVPPGWRSGCLGEVLGLLGLSFLIGMCDLVTASGKRRALATWSWDAGPVAAAGWLLEWAGSAAARGGAAPVVVLHPADLKRGFVPRASAAFDCFSTRDICLCHLNTWHKAWASL